MLPVGMVLGFLGYGFGTWGFILVKGYNVTLREWFSPLNPYRGALDANGCVPKGSIFPVKGKGGPCTGPNAKMGAGTSGGDPVKLSPTVQKLRKESPGPQGTK